MTDSYEIDDGGIFGYGLAMIEAANDDDYEEEDYGPSLAYPPLYVLRTADRCPECGESQHVYTLGCTAYRDAEDGGEPIDQFHFLHHIRSVPEPVLALLKAKLPNYYPDQAEGEGTPYLMNHCPCGAKLDDKHLHGDVGAAFWPDTEKGICGHASIPPAGDGTHPGRLLVHDWRRGIFEHRPGRGVVAQIGRPWQVRANVIG
jgi:hypothetical protein